MKHIRTSVLLALLIVSGFLFSDLWAQEKNEEKKKTKRPKNSYEQGYIVANHGDTTYGYIRIQDDFLNQRQLKFVDDYGVRAKYTPDRIKGFGVDGRDYEVLPTPINFAGLFSDSTIFLLRTVQGPASLYRFYTRRSVFTLKQGPSYIDLIKKPDGSLYEVSYNFKWVRIADAFPDFPELADAIRNELFKPEDTERIIERYNEWYVEGK
ncbi:MAG: hypothetical protein AAFR87_29100 [Bacteroidota bacterium]